MTQPTLADLRAWDMRRESTDKAYCPLCQCTKSGKTDVENSRTEACDDYDCRCHDGGEAHDYGQPCECRECGEEPK